MIKKQRTPFYVKLFTLIIRIRENEKKSADNLITSFKYKYYIFRDRARTVLGLYAAKFIFSKEKEVIEFLSSCYQKWRASHAQLFSRCISAFYFAQNAWFFC